ncbi:Hypothetical protein R9X50_00058600 [Acrodontium crateriforme]|uniref:Uncharacterized protein n=1 Tax=Acrodontium crateriforme TaxID=150365 RepID=A0AAQ3M0X0_9PEZI|nr:Hypothetical protein R9X50_00058600 [Acrodontium crateriforme]
MSDSSYSDESASPAAQTTRKNSTASEDSESSGSPTPEDLKPEPESSDEGNPTSLLPGERKPRSSRGHVARYRNLLNSVIEEVCSSRPLEDETGPLPGSQIGASFWTSNEKEAFFSALALRGPGDLPSLARAIGTKSIPEIQIYMQLLQSGVVEANATLQLDQSLDLSTVSAACEVSAECEAALEAASDALGRFVKEHEYESLKARLGDEWLIDQTVAQRLDDEFGEDRDDEEDDAKAEQSDDESPLGPFFGKADDSRIKDETTTSARLIRPSILLHLSENIFMNGQPGTGANWRDVLPDEKSIDSPAMVRTAFDDFYNLTISLTRRLVQASLFQAMTRLRASDASRVNWKPQSNVTAIDVTTAIDILGVKPNSKYFWAKTARKCDVNVYTDSSKYKDGRVSTKVGVQLTHDEVEIELGLPMASREPDERIKDALGTESDDYTIESVNEDNGAQPSNTISSESELEAEENEANTVHESETDEDSTAGKSMKRNRELSESDFIQAEFAYLDAFDQQASRFEERNLWEILGSEPTQLKVAADDELPDSPKASKTIRDSLSTSNWRHRVQYQAEWEVHNAPVNEDEFLAMEQSGQRGRKRRRNI